MTGPDNIPNRVLRNCAAEITPRLTRIIQHSLNTGRMAKCWKIANLTPLYKKGEKHQTGNYRPVSLLPCVSKVLERVVHNHVMDFLEDNRLLSYNQSAFRKGTSTTTHLQELYHQLARGMDQRKTAKIIFADISKAFDKVWHGGLLDKVHRLGIRGNLLRWLKDYLADRFQRVVLKGSTSSWLKIIAGVPQGSIMGPLLFMIFVDDIIRNLDCMACLFADDVNLFAIEQNEEECIKRLQPNVDKITEWALKWKMSMNPAKTETLTVKRTQNREVQLQMGGERI